MRSFSRRAYDNGVVIVQCPTCSARHLVADRLGWFGEPGSIEDFLRQRGQGRMDWAQNQPMRFLSGSTVMISSGGVDFITTSWKGLRAQACIGTLRMGRWR